MRGLILASLGLFAPSTSALAQFSNPQIVIGATEVLREVAANVGGPESIPAMRKLAPNGGSSDAACPSRSHAAPRPGSRMPSSNPTLERSIGTGI